MFVTVGLQRKMQDVFATIVGCGSVLRGMMNIQEKMQDIIATTAGSKSMSAMRCSANIITNVGEDR